MSEISPSIKYSKTLGSNNWLCGLALEAAKNATTKHEAAAIVDNIVDKIAVMRSMRNEASLCEAKLLLYVAQQMYEESVKPPQKTQRPAKCSKLVEGRRLGANEWVSYPSQSAAAKALGVSPGNISRCCRKPGNQTGGYEFRMGKPNEPAVLPGEVWMLYENANVSSKRPRASPSPPDPVAQQMYSEQLTKEGMQLAMMLKLSN